MFANAFSIYHEGDEYTTLANAFSITVDLELI
jgi:hypothetical protein